MFVADALLVVVMVGASAVAAVALPPNGMLPLDVGVGPGLHWIPKSAALVLWPALGVVTYLGTRVTGALGRMTLRSQVGVTIALALMLLAQTTSILVAIRRRGRP